MVDLLAVPFVLEVPVVQVPQLLPADPVDPDDPVYQEYHDLPLHHDHQTLL